MLGAHDWQGGAGDVHGAEQRGLDLRPEVLRPDLLEEPGVEVPRIVDQNVDTSEPFDGSLDGRLGVGGIGDIELDGQEAIVLAQGRCDAVDVAAGSHDRVAAG